MNEFRCEATAPDEMTVYVHGIIGGDVMGSELARVIDDARKAHTRRMVFDIYSPGGDVWEGNLVAAKMREAAEAGIETRAKVYAAASMATVLAVSADRVEIAANGRWLVHNPWTVAVGDAASLEKTAEELRATEREAAELYATVTGSTPEEMLDLMAEERWLMPAEALSLGFVDAIIPGTDPQDYAEPRASMLAQQGLPVMVAQWLASEETPADVPPADDHADAGAASGDEAAAATATDGATPATDQTTEAQHNAPEWEAMAARVAELTAENAALAGQVVAEKAENQRKEMALQDLQRRLKAFSPALHRGTDEDQAATAGVGDPAAYWRHVAELKTGGLDDERAHLEAARRWPDDHRALIRDATRRTRP